MKKLLSLISILVLVLSLACCGSGSTDSDKSNKEEDPSKAGASSVNGNEESTLSEHDITEDTEESNLSEHDITEDTTGEKESSTEISSPDGGHTHDPDGAPVTFVNSIDVGFKEEFNAAEDSAYHDLFFDKNYDDYKNKEFEKQGTFAKIYDAYNDVERYYVWGWGSTAKDCCYQWEFVMPSGAKIPSPGSYITVKGTMTESESALDGYWLTDISLSTEEEFNGSSADYDLAVMSPTLARVQLINMLQKSDEFMNVSIRIIGRTQGENTIIPAYTADGWALHFTPARDHIDDGSLVIIEGSYNTGTAHNMVKTSAVTAEK